MYRMFFLLFVIGTAHAGGIQGQAQQQGIFAIRADQTTQTTTNQATQTTTYDRAASTAIAMPGAVAGGDRRCAVGIGAGAQALGFGAAVAGVSTEENCVRLRDADMALMLNYQGRGADMAHAILCDGKHYRRGAKWVGIPCPELEQADVIVEREIR